MNTTQKESYLRPEVTKVDIDNEISVILMSVSAPNSPSGLPPIGNGADGSNGGSIDPES